MQGRTFEPDLDELEDNDSQKALTVLLYLKSMFESCSNFKLTSIPGRINLYCKLLVHHFGRDTIKSIIDAATKQMSRDTTSFPSNCLLNAIIPNSIEEMHLRLKFMFSAITDVFTAACEGGKRQTAMMYNELGINYTGKPIKSFFNLWASERLMHRPTPNDAEIGPLISKILSMSNKFYNRVGSVNSQMVAIGKNAEGMTEKLNDLAVKYSITLASNNSQNQEKYCDYFVVEILKALSELNNVISMCYVPNPDGLESQNLPYEKDCLKQSFYMRRLFFEMLCKLGTESTVSVAQNTLLQYQNVVVDLYNGWKNKQTGYQACWIPKKKNEHINQLSSMRTSFETYLTSRSSRNNKWHFTTPESYDKFIRNKNKLLVPDDFDIDKVTDINSFEWMLGQWLCHHTGGGQPTLSAHNPKFDVKPAFHHAMSWVFAFSVYDQVTCNNLIALCENNGLKEVSKYKREYVHELVNNQEMVHLVS